MILMSHTHIARTPQMVKTANRSLSGSFNQVVRQFWNQKQQDGLSTLMSASGQREAENEQKNDVIQSEI